MRKILVVLSISLCLWAAPLSAQQIATVTDEARTQINKEKHEARIHEAKKLLKELEKIQKRSQEIQKRLLELDGGAEAKEEKESNITTIQDTFYYDNRLK